jgi:predicted TPR repeat methyltransferase
MFTDSQPANSGSAACHDAYAADYDNQVRASGCYAGEVLFGLSFEYFRLGQSLLDLGIGTGLSAIPFAKAGLQVYGMDFSPAMLELCRAKGIALGLKCHDLGKSPWPYVANEFDHLVCCGVLHFLPDLDVVFREASRVLSAGGIFAFTTKVPSAPRSGEQEYEQALVDGMGVFSHYPEYVESSIEKHTFDCLRVLKFFVGQDAFSAWIVQE